MFRTLTSFLTKLYMLLITCNEFPHHRFIVAGDFNQYDRSFATGSLSLKNIAIGPKRFDSNWIKFMSIHLYVKDTFPRMLSSALRLGVRTTIPCMRRLPAGV